jgi:transposase InsO family protein
MYKNLDSKNMTDFYNHFDQQLKKENIPHYFIYPRCPKIDSFIERYNRTLQDDIIDPYLDLIHNKGVFGEKLTEFNIYYNSQRPHHSLNKKSPLQYFMDEGGMSQMSLTYTLLAIYIRCNI